MDEKATQEVIDKFYQSVINKDTGWKDLWADDIVFRDASGTLHAEGKSAVTESFVPFLRGVASLQEAEDRARLTGLLCSELHLCESEGGEYAPGRRRGMGSPQRQAGEAYDLFRCDGIPQFHAAVEPPPEFW